MKLDGKTVLITGAARGLGKAFAMGVLEKGAKAVVISDILDDVGRETTKEIQAIYGDEAALYIHADTTIEEEMKQAFAEAIKTYGNLDVVINNAAIAEAGIMEDNIDRILDVDLRGVIRGTEMAIEHMRTDRGGKGGVIINVSAQYAVTTCNVRPYYHAAKHGVLGYTRSRGLQIGDETGIKFRVLCPGAIRTDSNLEIQEMERQGDKNVIALLGTLGGWQLESEVVKACLLLIARDELEQNAVVLSLTEQHYIVRPEDLPAGREHEEDLPHNTLAVRIPGGTYQVFPEDMPRKQLE